MLSLWSYISKCFCCCAVTQLCLTASPWTVARQASMSFTVFHNLLKLMYIDSVMPSNHLILCRPLLLLPSIFSRIRVFSNESAFCIKWPSIGVSPSASVLPANIQGWFPLGLTGWISLLPKGLSRVFSSTTVWKHQFFSTQPFVVQLSHPYMTTGKVIAMTRQIFVRKVMSLLFNMLPTFIIAFLPRSKRLF